MILVVDDDEDMLGVVRRTLAPLKLELRCFSEPREALAALAGEADVQVLISDLDMPEISGFELLERAREMRPDVVRLLLTGRGSYEAAVRAINAGEVHRYIRKPFEASELRDAVISALARHEELRLAGKVAHDAVRRQRQLEQLELEYPGISQFERDLSGAYTIDSSRFMRAEKLLASLGILRNRH